MRKWLSITVAAGAVFLLLMSPLRAIGGEDRGSVHAKGGCTMGSTWELVMEPETGIKFEATIETGVPDQRWDITLKYESVVLLHEIETTEDDGGFEVIKVENNKQGEDHATVLATNLNTGERCWGKLQATL
jgi:hypothetical protein